METEHFDRSEVIDILKQFVEDIRQILPVVLAVVYDTDIEDGLDEYGYVQVAIFVRNFGSMDSIEAEDELLFLTEGYDICIAPALYRSTDLTRSKYIKQQLLPNSVEIWSSRT